MTEWDIRFFKLADYLSTWSKDKSTKVGCVIVGFNNEILSTGYNGLARLILEKEERVSGADKYDWMEHAERNAIYNAVRRGISIENCRIYINWFPCSDCARAIIQSGIKEIITTKPDLNHERWGLKFKIALEMLQEANILIRYYEIS